MHTIPANSYFCRQASTTNIITITHFTMKHKPSSLAAAVSTLTRRQTILTLLLAFSLLPTVQSCKQGSTEELSEEQKMELKKKRFQAGVRLDSLCSHRDFEQAILYLDTLHAEFPRDPQFYFAEGWIYDMQDNTPMSRAAFAKSLTIYDSLIAAKPDFGDMINRAAIVQILYGKKAYDKALDEIEATFRGEMDSIRLGMYMWRKVNYDKNELFKTTPEERRKYAPQH